MDTKPNMQFMSDGKTAILQIPGVCKHDEATAYKKKEP